jgi:hypothetical protein
MPDRSGKTESIDEMVRVGKLDRTRPSPRFQKELLNFAGEKIAGAQKAIVASNSLAFSGAYDATRHCVDAHLDANGLRAKSGDGAHRHRVEYAQHHMTDIISGDDLRLYATARQLRNETEYPQPGHQRLSNIEAGRAIDLAKAFHAAVKRYLDAPRSN